MSDLLTLVATGVAFTTLARTPFYLFAGLGEIVAEKSGVVNLGIEGIALMSLLTTFVVDYGTGNPWLALMAALAIAGLFGVVFALLAVYMGVDQIVLGLAIYLLGLGVSYNIYESLYLCLSCSAAPQFVNLPPVHIPGLSDISYNINVLTYIAIALVPIVAYFLSRTSFGLRVRAVGENPKAADNMGVNVNKVRFLAAVVGAVLSGVAGAYFAFSFQQSFNYDKIGGLGFVALAMIYLANWGPYKTLFAAVTFNLVYAIQTEIVSISPVYGGGGTSTLFSLIPYIYLIALIPILGRSARPPKFLLKPYKKG